MPTIYERLQEYRKLPEAVTFSNKRLRRLYNLLKHIYDKRNKNPPITFVESIEEDISFTVRNYPDTFQKTIDDLIWRFHLEILSIPQQDIKPTEKKAAIKGKRKRILVGTPIYSAKNNKAP